MRLHFPRFRFFLLAQGLSISSEYAERHARMYMVMLVAFTHKLGKPRCRVPT